MNIYDAIMKAANCIERDPDRYQWMMCYVGHCGTPACMLGWVGRCMGLPADTHNWDTAKAIGITSSRPGAWVFYDRLEEMTGRQPSTLETHQVPNVLRLYAEKYHGHEKPKAVEPPNWRVIMASPLIPEHVKSEDACHV